MNKSAVIANENCYITQEDSCLSPESQPYYYGFISRETAEWLLWDEGCIDGMYLLRNSSNDYVLSLCHQQSVLHYRITKLRSGELILQGLPQQKFATIIALIECVDGLACKPTRPVNASIGQCLPPTYWGLTADEIRDKLLTKAPDWGLARDELDCQMDDELHFLPGASPVVKQLVTATIHEMQPWFHYRLTRVEAERRLELSGHKDGKFLVRERDDSSYAICLSYENSVKHYRIDILSSGMFAIQDGPEFQSIIALISHYTIWSSGLYCALSSEVCRRPQDIIKLYAQQSNLKITRHVRSVSIERARNAINRSGSGGSGGGGGSPGSGRAGTPTNIKIKEWFTTINHKWTKIKKQTQQTLHKHQPLINDSSDYAEHISGNISSLLTLRRHNHHQCCHNGSHCQTTGNTGITTAQSSNRFGRSHEEPALGSGNIFGLTNDAFRPTDTRHTLNANNHNKSQNHNNNSCNNNNASNDSLLTPSTQQSSSRMVRSSSIDTIHALISDPIESVRRLHLRQHTLTPPVPAPRKSIRLTNQTIAKLYANQDVVQRTHSLDDSHKCGCNCKDWLVQFDDNLLMSSDDDLYGIVKQLPLHHQQQQHHIGNVIIDDCANNNNNNNRHQSLDLLTGNERKSSVISAAPKDQSQQLSQPSTTTTSAAEDLAQIFTNQSISCDLFDSNAGAKCLSLVTGNVPQISTNTTTTTNITAQSNSASDGTGDSISSSSSKSNTITTDGVINDKSIAIINNKFNNNNNVCNNLANDSQQQQQQRNNNTVNSQSNSDSRNDSNDDAIITGSSLTVNAGTGSSSTANTTTSTTTSTATNNSTSATVPPIIDLLKEFDVCFNNNNINNNGTTNGQNDDLIHEVNTSSSHHYQQQQMSMVNSMVNGLDYKTTTGINNNNNKSENGSVYEYDAIKLEKECIDQKASIGVADLDNTDNSARVELKEYDLICLDEEPEEVHKSLSKYRRGPLCFDAKCITLKRRIGNGYFGDVYLATIPSTSSSAIIQLAVKMLKAHASIRQKAEILREAQVMSKLDHKHIVRLIGVCSGEPFMLVMELAPLGPLNRYLCESGDHMTDDGLLKLMLQVAQAMRYLEDKCFVHRDLAARNVLLVTERFAKVSDFGMSRALSIGKDYYKARSASKWPLKWYAPECIYYYKFSSKSDVWSYGVTLWEVMSRGDMPYQGMDGQDILRMFKENRRLSKPDKCPVIIYQLMWNCWHFRPEDRLNFSQICDQLTRYLANRQKQQQQ
ncbi:RGS domain-containing serine/threonine-protein kinase A-like [Oppia nitens]|uniref:RGS domain-containing serine/threonine-protein kinase A-like n=1 Tax=Oppia nitens TaxID=1686743 RepID=UPI0023DC4E3E|nr:RGS domain-containing serine/threonine-protein kinase A-like [Oppia nitens]